MGTAHMNLDIITLARGGHSTRDDGICLMEGVAWFAGEPHTDRPRCASPVLGCFGRRLNDALPDGKRQQLRQYIPLMPGTAGDGLDEARGYLPLDWLIRVYAPAWLDLAGLGGEAAALRGLRPVTGPATIQAAHPAMRAARDAACDAAYDTACDTAWVPAGDAAWGPAWVAAGDVAGDVARVAARDAAGNAAGNAAWVAAGNAAGVAARDAAGVAAGVAARNAAWVAARNAARVAAGNAARVAAGNAARKAAGKAAGKALQPAVSRLQDSAIVLLGEMIRPGPAASHG